MVYKIGRNGLILAIHRLGVFYYTRREPNYDLSIEWFTKAAAKGNKDSSYNLGVIYSGSVKQNFKLAIEYFIVAERWLNVRNTMKSFIDSESDLNVIHAVVCNPKLADTVFTDSDLRPIKKIVNLQKAEVLHKVLLEKEILPGDVIKHICSYVQSVSF